MLQFLLLFRGYFFRDMQITSLRSRMDIDLSVLSVPRILSSDSLLVKKAQKRTPASSGSVMMIFWSKQRASCAVMPSSDSLKKQKPPPVARDLQFSLWKEVISSAPVRRSYCATSLRTMTTSSSHLSLFTSKRTLPSTSATSTSWSLLQARMLNLVPRTSTSTSPAEMTKGCRLSCMTSAQTSPSTKILRWRPLKWVGQVTRVPELSHRSVPSARRSSLRWPAGTSTSSHSGVCAVLVQRSETAISSGTISTAAIRCVHRTTVVRRRGAVRAGTEWPMRRQNSSNAACASAGFSLRTSPSRAPSSRSASDELPLSANHCWMRTSSPSLQRPQK